MNLYNKIYNAVNEGIQKALLIDPDQNDVSINYSYHKINNEINPMSLVNFIDLGLPSGLKWAEYNLGAFPANTIESWIGNYYAWGQIEQRGEYNWANYKFSIDHKGLDFWRYKVLLGYPPKTLCEDDDIANNYYTNLYKHNINGKYRMPSKDEFYDLIDNTNTTFANDYNGIPGLKGWILTSKHNGNFIFIPACGYYSGTHLIDNESCYLWTNNLHLTASYEAYNFYIHAINQKPTCSSHSRMLGLPVRAVQIK